MSLMYLDNNIEGVSAIIDDELDPNSVNAISTKAANEAVKELVMPHIAYGVIPMSSFAPGKGKTTRIPLDFKPDAVIVQMTSANATSAMGWAEAYVIQSSISSTGFTVEIHNAGENYKKTHKIGARWIAIKEN